MGWAAACVPYAGDQVGLFAVPPVGGTCVPTGTPMMIAYAGQAKVMAQ